MGAQSSALYLWEFLAPSGATVRECTTLAAAVVGVAPTAPPLHEVDDSRQHIPSPATSSDADWHLCTTGWNGDMGVVLDDLDRPLRAAKVQPNDVLLLERGRVLPRGFCDVRLSWFRPHLFGAEATDRASVAQCIAGNLVQQYLAAAVRLVCTPDMLAAVGAVGSTAAAPAADAVQQAADGQPVSCGTTRPRGKGKRTTKIAKPSARTEFGLASGPSNSGAGSGTSRATGSTTSNPNGTDAGSNNDSTGLAAYIDTIDLAVDARIVPLGPLRCPNLLTPRDLLTNHVARMPAVQHLLRNNADTLFPRRPPHGTTKAASQALAAPRGSSSVPPDTGPQTHGNGGGGVDNWLQRVRIREVKEGHLARVLCDSPAGNVPHTSSAPKARLYTTQHLCLEFLDLRPLPQGAPPCTAADPNHAAGSPDDHATNPHTNCDPKAAPASVGAKKKTGRLPANVSTFLPAVTARAKPRKHVVGGKKPAATKKKSAGTTKSKAGGSTSGAMLYVHAARRDRERCSYHRTVEVALPTPVTADSLRAHLARATGIAPPTLCAYKHNRKTHTWSPLLLATEAGEAPPPATPTHAAPKGVGTPASLKNALKSGDVIAVTDAAAGVDDMTSCADRAHLMRKAWAAAQRTGTAAAPDSTHHVAESTPDSKRRDGPLLRISVPTSFDAAM